MKTFLSVALLIILGIWPNVSLGYSVTSHVVSKPYEVLSLPGSPETQQIVIGELNDYPDMVEVVSDTDFVLSVEIRALPFEPVPDLNGIVVKVLDVRGVAEVARLLPEEATWEERVDPVSKLSYLAGPIVATATAAGTYRVEVSTPNNIGKYMLVIGNRPVYAGYGATWQAVASVYDFYGVSKIGMIRTSLLYMPLLIMLVIVGFGYTVYRTRHRFLRSRTQ